MARRTFRRAQALGLAAGLVGWSATMGLEVPGRRHPLVQAGLAAGLVALTRAPLGMRPPALCSGVRLGLAAGSAVVVSVAIGTASPRVREAMLRRDLPAPAALWLALRIPVGTVWSEEAAYRAALRTAAANAYGRNVGRLLQATAFGLSHIYDARATGEPVIGTVLVTGAAGWLFGWLADRSGSVAAPMLTHLAVNEGAAVAALVLHASRGNVRR